MKIPLPASIVLGFVLSVGANQMSAATQIQPLPSLPYQDQVIHVRWKSTNDVNASSRHSLKRAHTSHQHHKSNIEHKHIHHPTVSPHTRYHLEHKRLHHPTVSPHTRPHRHR